MGRARLSFTWLGASLTLTLSLGSDSAPHTPAGVAIDTVQGWRRD